MGNHFRTSGAGDDAPKTQTGVQGSRFATPDSEGQPVAQAPAQLADQAQPASDPFACNPTSDVALSGTAGFERVIEACDLGRLIALDHRGSRLRGVGNCGKET